MHFFCVSEMLGGNMVITCSKKEETMLLAYLEQDAVYHTFLLADIINFGFEREFQTVYADIRDGEVKGVYLKFYSNLIVAGREEDLAEEFLKELFENWKPQVIMGKLALVQRIHKLLPEYNESFKWLYAMESQITEENGMAELPKRAAVRSGEPGDEDKIHEFLMGISEIRALYTSKDMIRDRLVNKDGTHLFMEQDGEMIAHVNSAARSPYYTMIGGVAVKEDLRGNHLSGVLLKEICQEILRENRKPCCFSDRDEEHNLFTALGFIKAGAWGTLTRE